MRAYRFRVAAFVESGLARRSAPGRAGHGRATRGGDAREARHRRAPGRRLPRPRAEPRGPLRLHVPPGRRPRRPRLRVAAARRHHVRAPRGLRGARDPRLPGEERARAPLPEGALPRRSRQPGQVRARHDRRGAAEGGRRRAAARRVREARGRDRLARRARDDARPRPVHHEVAVRGRALPLERRRRARDGQEAEARAGVLPGRGRAGARAPLRHRSAALLPRRGPARGGLGRPRARRLRLRGQPGARPLDVLRDERPLPRDARPRVPRVRLQDRARHPEEAAERRGGAGAGLRGHLLRRADDAGRDAPRGVRRGHRPRALRRRARGLAARAGEGGRARDPRAAVRRRQRLLAAEPRQGGGRRPREPLRRTTCRSTTCSTR